MWVPERPRANQLSLASLLLRAMGAQCSLARGPLSAARLGTHVMRVPFLHSAALLCAFGTAGIAFLTRLDIFNSIRARALFANAIAVARW